MGRKDHTLCHLSAIPSFEAFQLHQLPYFFHQQNVWLKICCNLEAQALPRVPTAPLSSLVPLCYCPSTLIPIYP